MSAESTLVREYAEVELRRIRDYIVRDDEAALYTLLDYLTQASRMPASFLFFLTNIESETERRHIMRSFSVPPTRARIWKKCRMSDL